MKVCRRDNRRVQGWIRAVFLVLLAVAGESASSARAAEEINVRLHFSWGGSVEQKWRGRVSLPSGRLSEMRLLGVGPEQPGSVQLHGQQILIHQKRPCRYDGFEVTVSAPRDASMRIELLPAGAVRSRTVTLSLGEILQSSQSQVLDDRGSRMIVRRVASDLVPLSFDRDHLVFSPAETFRFGISGKLLPVGQDATIRCRLELRRTGQRDVLWDESLKSRVDATGSWLDEQFVDLELPTEEGVYDLSMVMTMRRRTPPFSSEILAERWLQFVVVQPTVTPGPNQESRRLVLEVDPTQANWFQRLTRLPQWSLLPGFRPDGPLGNVKVDSVELEGQSWTRLPAGGWQAYPLPVDRVGRRHELEVQVPRGHDQSLAFSIVEANAAEKVIPVGVDSALSVERNSNRGLATVQSSDLRHRIPFWPKSKTPLLLVTNLDRDNPAIFGRLEVYRQRPGRMAKQQPGRRSVIAFFERPLFPETFGATESLDAQTGRSLEDWQTFYEGAVRFVEHAKDVGYDALAVAAATEGSTLYPTRLLQPTPKHDRGIFFSTGQDPIRKDVLELMFRLCDREGLKLVPTVEFATPLPRLERQLLDAERSVGIRLVDANRQKHTDISPPQRGRAAYYNPLDERVQHAMREVIAELARRYGHHESFGGVSVNLHGNSYSQLPDREWGVDLRTWSRFCSETKVTGRPDAMSPEVLEQWTEWRCKQVGKLYTAMADDLRSSNSNARLYMLTSRLVSARPIQRAFRPTLPPQSDLVGALRELALDPKFLDENDAIVFTRPRFFLPPDDTTASLSAEEFNDSATVDTFFGERKNSGTSLLHEPRLMRLPSFDDASPFGTSNTFMSLVAQVSPAGSENRRRFIQALAREDSRVIFEGGWRIPIGQDESLRDFMRVYRELPDVPFETVDGSDRWQPLRVRTASYKNETYFYVVNDSPWFVGASVQLEEAATADFQGLGQDNDRAIIRDGDQTTWNLTLAPYDLVAVKADRLGVKVANVDVNLPPDVLPALANHIDQLARRAAQLADPEPLGLLLNSSFDRWRADEPMPDGWMHVGSIGSVKRETDEVYHGKHALRAMVQGGKLELLSDPIQPPSSGRLSVSLRAKVPQNGSPLRMRLLLEVDGRKYYPWSPIEAGESGRVLNTEWKEFVFRVNQLPPVRDTIRIGVEVAGRGELLVDEVGLFDVLVLDDSEQQSLSRILTVADRQCRRTMVSDCLRILSSYWPQYLTDNVPEVEQPEVAERRSVSAARPKRQAKPASWYDLRRLLPNR